jgi:hypothetical protein
MYVSENRNMRCAGDTNTESKCDSNTAARLQYQPWNCGKLTQLLISYLGSLIQFQKLYGHVIATITTISKRCTQTGYPCWDRMMGCFKVHQHSKVICANLRFNISFGHLFVISYDMQIYRGSTFYPTPHTGAPLWKRIKITKLWVQPIQSSNQI